MLQCSVQSLKMCKLQHIWLLMTWKKLKIATRCKNKTIKACQIKCEYIKSGNMQEMLSLLLQQDNAPPCPLFFTPFSVAEKQIHEEDPQRCWGVQRLGGGSRLSQQTFCSLRPPGPSYDPGRSDRGPCSHQVKSSAARHGTWPPLHQIHLHSQIIQ